jgi:flagellar hook-associated protein 2
MGGATTLANLPLGRTLTAGTFTIEGKTITIALTDTLDQVASKISTATGLSASFAADKFTIGPSPTPVSFGSSADTSNFLQAAGIVSKTADESRTGAYDFSFWSGHDDGVDKYFFSPGPSLPYLATPGYFTINGQTINFDPDFDTQNTFLAQITSVPGVTGASFVGGFLQINSSVPLVMASGTSDVLDYLGIKTIAEGGPAALPVANYKAETSGNLGKVDLTAPLTSSNLGVTPGAGTGSFYVNGAEIAYDTSTDTIQDIMDRITGSAAQVMASYDLANDAIVLTNKKTGNVGTFVTTTDPATTNPNSDTQNLVSALFGTLTTVSVGRDAVFSVNNGGDLTSRSNAFDETVHGIRGLTVDATAQSPLTATYNSGTNTWTNASAVTQKVTVKGDPSAARDAVNTFITNYNALQAVIEKHTKVTYSDGKVTTGVLAGSREMADVSRTLRQELFRNIGFSGSIQRLSDMGVTSSGIENVISLSNSALLESKINTDASGVLDYFGNSTNGLITRLNRLLGDSSTDVSAASGKIGIQLTTIQKQNTSLDKQIAEFERRLESQRQLMESSFIAMERAQSKFQQQSSYLQRTFASNNK